MTAKLPFAQLTDYVQNLVRNSEFYQRAKSSWIYEFYWNIVDKRIIQDRSSEVEFYRNLLDGFRKGDLIFDVGANEGYKTGIFLELGATVVAVEPDETCIKILKERFVKHRLKSNPLLIVAKAASDRSSVETMWIDTPGSAKNTLNRKWVETLRGDHTRFGQKLNFAQQKTVETISIEQLISAHGLPFLVKIDVEGHELRVLRGLEHPVPYLSFEVNFPEFAPEGLECVQVLGALDRDGKFNYTADCRRGLALRQWLGKEEFSAVLHSCPDKSIEVIWKTSCTRDK